MTARPKLALVVARAANGVIGRDGDLPWRLSSDLRRFKDVTMGKPCIMGRLTWESLPLRPLPGRLNIVLTRDGGYEAKGALVVANLDEALEIAREQAQDDGVDEVCVIGGAALLASAMDRAHRVYLTEVDASPDGDVRIPDFSDADWIKTEHQPHPAGERDDHAFVFKTLERRR